ncbi:hypothetical protein Bbelb_230020 [Branchiostoma belcheri]|nr:hypothetical protein Bbelb_230020 [Branchiostoma belcheri]
MSHGEDALFPARRELQHRDRSRRGAPVRGNCQTGERRELERRTAGEESARVHDIRRDKAAFGSATVTYCSFVPKTDRRSRPEVNRQRRRTIGDCIALGRVTRADNLDIAMHETKAPVRQGRHDDPSACTGMYREEGITGWQIVMLHGYSQFK